MVSKEQLMKKFEEYGVKKGALLLLLTFLATFTALLAKYSMPDGKKLYIKSTVVVWMEVIKFVTSIFLVLIESRSIPKFARQIYKDIITQPITCLKVSVPSFLYVVQNNLLLVAYKRLDVATYQVTYQLKILTTAIFCVILLKKYIRIPQWFALIILTSGVVIVGLTTEKNKTDDNSSLYVNPNKDYIIGLVALIMASCTSGFSGVYFEKMLKNSGFSIWILNLQLAGFGIILSIIVCFANDFKSIKSDGFFVGYNYVVWSLVLVQALGGFVIALVIKHADNILKGFSTSFSIVLSAVLSYYIFGTTLNYCFMLGALLVILSIIMYSYFAR